VAVTFFPVELTAFESGGIARTPDNSASRSAEESEHFAHAAGQDLSSRSESADCSAVNPPVPSSLNILPTLGQKLEAIECVLCIDPALPSFCQARLHVVKFGYDEGGLA
jgi:predicted heme/steroid binding protein